MSRTRKTLPRVGRQDEVQGVHEGEARRKLFVIRSDKGERDYEQHARSQRARLPRRDKWKVPPLSGPRDQYYFDRSYDDYGCDDYYDDLHDILMELVLDGEGCALVAWDEDPEFNERMLALFYGVASSGSSL